MDWLQILTLIIEAVSALTTVAAVLVALYQTKYADRIRLKFIIIMKQVEKQKRVMNILMLSA